MFTRREFFQSLAASALALGVLPVGFPTKGPRVPLGQYVPPDFLDDPRWIGNLASAEPDRVAIMGFIAHHTH